MMISKLRISVILLFLTVTAITAAAVRQDTVVSFVNFYPGSDIYELEGHSALRIDMPAGDFAISYGTYNFDQPNFVYRFVKGETDYWVTAVPWQYMDNAYRKAGRRIVEHRIAMTPLQKQRLLELVNDNLRPENRTYRYNYVKDNCATRPLQILQLAMGDSIILDNAPDEIAGCETFRDIMRHYHVNYPWYQFGIDLALGSGIDYKLNEREKAFAPVVLDRQLPGATAGGRQLVESTTVINDVSADGAVCPPTPYLLSPLFISIIILAITTIISARDIRRHRISRWFDSALFGVFGLAGCVISFLVFISVHEATSPNILLLWLNPLCFIPAFLIWINRCKVIIFSYQIVNFVALMVLLALSIADVQTLNIAFYPLILADALRAITYIYLYISNNKCHEKIRQFHHVWHWC